MLYRRTGTKNPAAYRIHHRRPRPAAPVSKRRSPFSRTALGVRVPRIGGRQRIYTQVMRIANAGRHATGSSILTRGQLTLCLIRRSAAAFRTPCTKRLHFRLCLQAESNSALKMHFQKLQKLIPIRRNRPVSAGVLEIADRVEHSGSRRGHLIGIQSLFAEQPEYGTGRDRG